MKERPILFSGPMVRALLAGKKTQTRRLVKRRKDGELPQVFQDGMFWFADGDAFAMDCPHGEPGDRLWVREAWRASHQYDAAKPSEIADSGASVMYECDGTYRNWDHLRAGRYRHARFMPRWASRLNRELVEVRVERLQEISEEDSLAEGVTAMEGQFAGCFVVPGPGPSAMSGTTAKECYGRLWESINGAGAGRWAMNPLVWAVTMKEVLA